jgi:hypothetical protein
MSFAGQVFEQVERFTTQMNEDRHAGFLADETHGAVGPVHVLAFQARDVALACTQVPAQLVKIFPLRIHFGSDDLLVFLKCDGAFLFVVDGGPLSAGNDGRRQPIHIEGEVVNLPQKRIR